MLKIAVSKGKVEKEFCKVLEKIGYDINPIINKRRKLLIKLNDNLEMIFVKPEDIGTYMEFGSVDIGILGNDVLIEQDFSNYSELLDLNIGKCKFCLASFQDYESKMSNKKIATKYPKITQKYFKEKNENVEIIKLNGSVELGPIVQISDAIVDIVETGNTLKENGLKVIDEICDISTRLIASNKSLNNKNVEIYEFVNKLKEEKIC